jgi:hypothetical protein
VLSIEINWDIGIILKLLQVGEIRQAYTRNFVASVFSKVEHMDVFRKLVYGCSNMQKEEKEQVATASM